ncbi:MAG: flagellar L-ring protein precursor FlgH [Mariniblastus sp.]|jgi:flagellar L-ring protein precursor FlgH
MNHRNLFLMATAAVCVFALTEASAFAQVPSIWKNANANMYGDVKASQAGDLLFVNVDEQSAVQNQDQRTLTKTNSSSSDANGTIAAGGDVGTAAGNLGFTQDSSANRNFAGNANYRSDRGFTDRFTVMVVDVLPNGNLIISGERQVSLEGDGRKLVLTGVVRGFDVSRENTISSKMISNLTIRYETVKDEGAEKRFINQGWLGKKLNRLWPH